MIDHPIWRFENQMPEGREFEIYHAANTTPQPTIYQGHHFYELYFILRGSIRVIVEEQDLRPVLGEALIYPPHCMHRVMHTDPSIPYERFYIYLSREYLQAMSTPEYNLADALDGLTGGGRYCFTPGETAVSELVPLADEIIEAAKDTSPAAVLANRCRMTVLLIRLLGLLEASVVRAENASSRMHQLICYINQHITQPLSLDQLVSVFGITKYALLHEFKEHTGMSIHQFILTRRVFLAQQLIDQGAKPNQVCEQSGFADYTSFYRAFKARTGKSPNQYSKQQNP